MVETCNSILLDWGRTRSVIGLAVPTISMRRRRAAKRLGAPDMAWCSASPKMSNRPIAIIQSNFGLLLGFLCF
jgi:hypothetical protein